MKEEQADSCAIPMFAETLDGRGNFSIVKRKGLGPVQDNWRLVFVDFTLFHSVEIAIAVPFRCEKPHGIVQLLDDGIITSVDGVYKWAVLFSEVEWDAAAKQFRPREGTPWGVRCATSKADAERQYGELRKKLDGYATRLAAQPPPPSVQPFNKHQHALLAVFREVYPETVKALKNWDLFLRKGCDTTGSMKTAVEKYLAEYNHYTKKPTTHAKWWILYNWFDKHLDKMSAEQLAKELTNATKHTFKPNTAHKLRERMELPTHLKSGPPPRSPLPA